MHANRRARLADRRDAAILAEEPQIDGDENRQHAAGDERGRLPQVFRRPEEIDAVEEADEQRRIAERRQRAADIADEEDEEHHDMDVVQPRRIGPDQRPDQNHRGAGSADDAGNERAEGEHQRIDQRRAAHRAGDHDAAGDHIEREQDGDEAEIVAKQRMRQGRQRGIDAAQRRERGERQRRPDEGEFAVVVMPDAPDDKRRERDGQQNADERQLPRPGQRGAVERGGLGRVGQRYRDDEKRDEACGHGITTLPWPRGNCIMAARETRRGGMNRGHPSFSKSCDHACDAWL